MTEESKIVPVIMCGGAGTRLWPLSREKFPKQFLAFGDDRSLFQQAVERVAGVSERTPVVVTNAEHRFLARAQLDEIGVEAHFLLEPVGRNTAPAAAVAALTALDEDEDSLVLLLPADHAIRDSERLRQAFREAAAVCTGGHLVTFGIRPSGPETGYGYIQVGEALSDSGARSVARFVEKPDQKTAESYLEQGGFLWNSGMFMFRASDYLEELRANKPEMVKCSERALAAARRQFGFVFLDEKEFAEIEGDSVDYAVMEQTQRAAVLPLDIAWNDLGSWTAVAAEMEADEFENAVVGDVMLTDCRRSLVYAQSRLVGVVGVDDLVVVETPDAVLVADRSNCQNVKDLVGCLREEGRSEADLHRKVYRPWGSYDSVDVGSRHQVKRIVVAPGEKLSLQLHHQRSEHWVVVKGRGVVTLDEEQFEIGANESTYIPKETKHRLENPYEEPLEIVEVQVGDYLGEDDIVRFDDTYGRAGSDSKGSAA